MSSEKEGASLTTDVNTMDELPGPSSASSKQDFQGAAMENEDLSGKGEGNGRKQEFRSPNTVPMLPPEVNCPLR